MSRRHRPVLVNFDLELLTTPAEVCWGCSDEVAGLWVPVSQCAHAYACMMEPQSDEYPEPGVYVAALPQFDEALDGSTSYAAVADDESMPATPGRVGRKSRRLRRRPDSRVLAAAVLW